MWTWPPGARGCRAEGLSMLIRTSGVQARGAGRRIEPPACGWLYGGWELRLVRGADQVQVVADCCGGGGARVGCVGGGEAKGGGGRAGWRAGG
jgi:hypothetical protein